LTNPTLKVQKEIPNSWMTRMNRVLSVTPISNAKIIQCFHPADFGAGNSQIHRGFGTASLQPLPNALANK